MLSETVLCQCLRQNLVEAEDYHRLRCDTVLWCLRRLACLLHNHSYKLLSCYSPLMVVCIPFAALYTSKSDETVGCMCSG